MAIYPSNAIYSMIPKNACSTLRLSIGMANGAIENVQDWRWIHLNNDAFQPTLRDIATASYSFAFLRCPYARLVSCFLDKFVSRTPDAWHFHQLIDEDVDLAHLTFRRFCSELIKPAIRHANIHWRPQVDFLVYDTYDDLFCVENFSAAAQILVERIGLMLVDSRPHVRHDSSQYKILPSIKNFADTEIWQIEAMMIGGLRPDPASFFDSELRELTAIAFAADFKLYSSLFQGRGVFDKPSQLLAAS